MKKNESEKEKKPHNRIAELRKDRGLTIQQVADGIGVSNGTISRYEKGTREPKLETWVKLADFFGVSVSYLQGISENSEPLFTLGSSATEIKGMIDFFDSQTKGEKSLSPNDLIKKIKQLPTEQRAVISGNFSIFLYCIDFLMANDEYQIIGSLGDLFGIILAVQLTESRSQDVKQQIENYIDIAVSKINKIHKKDSIEGKRQ